MSERPVGHPAVKLKGPARGRLLRRSASQELEPDPRVSNGQARRSSRDTLLAGLKNVNLHTRDDVGESAGGCSCHQEQSGVSAGSAKVSAKVESETPPLLLHGARTEPSALLKVQATVHGVGGIDVSVQPMIDSGASGMGFVDPALVQRCGVKLRPSSRRITLADGSEVRAAGEATLSYSLAARTCRQ